jgi:hypothetical protein
MGCSATAKLLFGVPLDYEQHPFARYNDDYETVDNLGNPLTEEEYDALTDDTDLGEYLAARSGNDNPWKTYPPYLERDEYGPYDEFQTWLATTPEGKELDRLTDAWRDLKHELEDAAPVEIVYAGDLQYGSAQYVIALKGYANSVDWGAEKIDLPEQPSQEEVDVAIEFCRANALPDFSDAGWVLAAQYG